MILLISSFGFYTHYSNDIYRSFYSYSFAYIINFKCNSIHIGRRCYILNSACPFIIAVIPLQIFVYNILHDNVIANQPQLINYYYALAKLTA